MKNKKKQKNIVFLKLMIILRSQTHSKVIHAKT